MMCVLRFGDYGGGTLNISGIFEQNCVGTESEGVRAVLFPRGMVQIM